MKHVLIFIFISSTLLAKAQEEPKKFRRYTAVHLLEVQPNFENRLLNNEYAKGTGFGLELNTHHGFLIRKRLVLSLGTGLNFNFNKDFQAIPIIVEAKFYFEKYAEKGVYILLNTGTNLSIENFDSGGGAKIAAGYLVPTHQRFGLCFEVFKKARGYDDPENFPEQYRTISYGVAVGLKF